MYNTTVDLIKQRLKYEIDNCGLTKAEIAKRVGVSSEMITQYAVSYTHLTLPTNSRV